MNSKQRRQLERKTKYKVTLERRGDEDWDDFDYRVEKAISWVKKKAKGEYFIQNRFSAGTFNFQKESDAVHFGLLWI